MEYLERIKALVGEKIEKIRPLNLTLGQLDKLESWFPVKRKIEMSWSGYLERAKVIVDGQVDTDRFKTLTLGQVQKSDRSHPVGKAGEEMWNYGERVLAFEDGTLAFKESGSDLWEALDDPDGLARWIRFLDRFDEQWESGPPSRIPISKVH